MCMSVLHDADAQDSVQCPQMPQMQIKGGGGGQVPCWSALEQDLAPFQNKSLSLKYSSFVVDVVVVLLLNSLTSSVHVASYKSGLINEWIN